MREDATGLPAYRCGTVTRYDLRAAVAAAAAAAAEYVETRRESFYFRFH